MFLLAYINVYERLLAPINVPGSWILDRRRNSNLVLQFTSNYVELKPNLREFALDYV